MSLRQLFDQARHNSEQRAYRYARLGKHNPSDDSVTFEVPGRVDWLYITWPDASVDVARNEAGVAQTEDMEVKLKRDNLGWVIVGRSTKGALTVPTATPPSGVLPHTLGEHTNVNASSPADGDLLGYSSTPGKWANVATIPTPLAATIHAATSKNPPVDADELGLVDSATSNVLKKLTWANLKAAIKTYYDSVATTLTNKTLDSTNISTLTAKNPPVDADSAVIVDSAASNVFKRVTYTNVKAFLKTYFDTLYNLYVHPNHTGDVTSVGDGATTIAAHAVTNSKLRQSAAMSVLANNLAITADVIDLSATGGTDSVLRESGSNIGWGTIATGAMGDNIVTNGKLRDSGALSVIGRSANSGGDPADISASAASDAVLRESGSAIGWGTIATGGIANNAVTNAKAADMANATVKGRTTAGTGDPEDLTMAQLVALIEAQALYLLLAGRSGGQTAYFNTASGGSGTVSSTAHAIKGKLLFGAAGNSAYDEANERWGFGTNAPSFLVHAKLNSNAAIRAAVENTNASTAAQALFDARNDAGHSFQAGATGSGFTPSGPIGADTVYFQANGSPLVVRTIGAFDIVFAINSSTEIMRILNAGGVSVGGLTSMGANQLGVKAGTSSNDAAVGGVLSVQTGAVGNVGSGDDDLLTYTIPANTLAVNGQSIWFEAYGTLANNGNTKTVRVKFGTDSSIVIAAAMDTSNTTWSLKGRIFRTGASAQKIFIDVLNSGDVTGNQNTIVATGTQTLSSSVVLKVTGDATSNNDVVCEALIVGWDDANT